MAFEFPFFGDYRADLLVGSKSAGHFCAVEFEDGGPDSIFKNQPNRPNPEWSGRFEHGFSQLTDWFFNLDDYKKSHGFTKTFGYGHVSFTGLLVIGRATGLDDMKSPGPRWRSDKVLVDSNAVIRVTFDDVYEILKKRDPRCTRRQPWWRNRWRTHQTHPYRKCRTRSSPRDAMCHQSPRGLGYVS